MRILLIVSGKLRPRFGSLKVSSNHETHHFLTLRASSLQELGHGGQGRFRLDQRSDLSSELSPVLYVATDVAALAYRLSLSTGSTLQRLWKIREAEYVLVGGSGKAHACFE